MNVDGAVDRRFARIHIICRGNEKVSAEVALFA